MKSSSRDEPPPWSLLTNHGQVLVCIATDPDARLRDIAERVGVTERTAAQIVTELGRAGYLTKTRIGRRNRYRVEGDRKVAVAFGTVTVGQLLSVVLQALERQPFG
jgi:DNA-binding MarR family transcriptional regulator